VALPPQPEFDQWTLEAVKLLGGVRHRAVIQEKAKKLATLTPAQLREPSIHPSYATKVDHRIASSLTRLKQRGFLRNPRRGYWELDPAAASSLASTSKHPERRTL
jgi:restriction endonuclease Mrr